MTVISLMNEENPKIHCLKKNEKIFGKCYSMLNHRKLSGRKKSVPK